MLYAVSNQVHKTRGTQRWESLQKMLSTGSCLPSTLVFGSDLLTTSLRPPGHEIVQHHLRVDGKSAVSQGLMPVGWASLQAQSKPVMQGRRCGDSEDAKPVQHGPDHPCTSHGDLGQRGRPAARSAGARFCYQTNLLSSPFPSLTCTHPSLSEHYLSLSLVCPSSPSCPPNLQT